MHKDGADQKHLCSSLVVTILLHAVEQHGASSMLSPAPRSQDIPRGQGSPTAATHETGALQSNRVQDFVGLEASRGGSAFPISSEPPKQGACRKAQLESLPCRKDHSKSSAALQPHGPEVLFQPQHRGVLISTHPAMVHVFPHKAHSADRILQVFSSKQTQKATCQPSR